MKKFTILAAIFVATLGFSSVGSAADSFLIGLSSSEAKFDSMGVDSDGINLTFLRTPEADEFGFYGSIGTSEATFSADNQRLDFTSTNFSGGVTIDLPGDWFALGGMSLHTNYTNVIDNYSIALSTDNWGLDYGIGYRGKDHFIGTLMASTANDFVCLSAGWEF